MCLRLYRRSFPFTCGNARLRFRLYRISRLSHRRGEPHAQAGSAAAFAVFFLILLMISQVIEGMSGSTNSNGGLKWIRKGGGYYSERNERLKG